MFENWVCVACSTEGQPAATSHVMRKAITAVLIASFACLQPSLTHAVAKTEIDPLTAQALFLELLNSTNRVLGSATGFITKHNEKHFLITNWHVVTGRHPETGLLLKPEFADLTRIRIYH